LTFSKADLQLMIRQLWYPCCSENS